MNRGAWSGQLRADQPASTGGGQGRGLESAFGGPEAVTAREYVSTVLDCYTSLPDTPARARKNDRTLAESLYEKQTPLEVVRAAFLLVTCRRWFRLDDAGPLEPIRSLYYFVPVINELQRSPPPAIYVERLRERLRTGFPAIGVPGLPETISW